MDFKELATQRNKEKIAVIVVGYNRKNGIERLLDSINTAFYDDNNIPLVISIDASGNQLLYDYVKSFNWKHGEKYVNIQENRLGLKAHIFQCASLSKYFKGVIILEDDLFVSPYYYHYCTECLEQYGSNEKVAGISLYSEEINGYVGLPFQPEQRGSDVYAWQTVCSWGEMWNERMWNGFTSWLDSWDENFDDIDMVDTIKKWTRAWSKYYYAYMIKNDKYFIYPYNSLTTNFNDAGGEHGGGNASIVQVSLLQGKRTYHLDEFESLVKYDVYSQNKEIPQWLGIDKNNLTIDLYGLKKEYRGHYILTPFKLPYKIVESFGLSLRPWELNIKYKNKGNGLFLYYRDHDYSKDEPNKSFPLEVGDYYLRGFNLPILIKYVWKRIKVSFKRKFTK